jgi:hypothetical protein
MVLHYSIIVFVTQLIFIGCRTWNVKAIAAKNIPQVLISGTFVHLSWLVSIAIGAVSMHEIIYKRTKLAHYILKQGIKRKFKK